MPHQVMDFLDGLNPRQREAVEHMRDWISWMSSSGSRAARECITLDRATSLD